MGIRTEMEHALPVLNVVKRVGHRLDLVPEGKINCLAFMKMYFLIELIFSGLEYAAFSCTRHVLQP